MNANSSFNIGWTVRTALSCVLLVATTGCETFLNFLTPPITTVRLVNDCDFAVRATVVYADEQNMPRAVLEEVGTHLEFMLEPGEVASFNRSCNALQIVAIEDADLLVIGGSGPSTSSETLRDGSDFRCRSIITFTFDHSAIVSDFAVTATVAN